MRYLLLLSLLLAGYFPLLAQVELGIKLGFNSTQLNPEKISFKDPQTFEDFTLEVEDAKYGVHFGALLKIYMNKFFIQPEVILNSSTTTYTYKNITTEKVLEENYQFLDVPLMMGFDLGVLNIFGGPVGHVHISSTSEMDNDGVKGYLPKWSDFQWGWQAGVGFDIWKLNIDLRYEGNFYNYGNHINIFGNRYDFQDKPSRIITSIAFIF